MAYADGILNEFEENVVWRVAELLGVSSRARVSLRQEAKDEADERARQDSANPSPADPGQKPESDD